MSIHRPAALLLALTLCAAHAQEPLQFDVISIKTNNLPARERRHEHGCANGRFVALGDPLRYLWLDTFQIKPYQLAELPSWFDTAIFDIEAKSERPITRDECRMMVQSLLARRFALRIHREQKLIDVLVLVVAKGGPKFQPANTPDGVEVLINGQPLRFGYLGPPGTEPKLQRGWTMEQLTGPVISFASAWSLGNKPVFDRTGLTGRYEFTLDFSATPPGAPATSNAPDIFDALDRIGLKLEQRKESVEMLVIDHIEKPSEN